MAFNWEYSDFTVFMNLIRSMLSEITLLKLLSNLTEAKELNSVYLMNEKKNMYHSPVVLMFPGRQWQLTVCERCGRPFPDGLHSIPSISTRLDWPTTTQGLQQELIN